MKTNKSNNLHLISDFHFFFLLQIISYITPHLKKMEDTNDFFPIEDTGYFSNLTGWIVKLGHGEVIFLDQRA